MFLLLMFLTYPTKSYSLTCELPDWYCEATEECVAYNQTCSGTCYITPPIYPTCSGCSDILWNNEIYYCALTDSCHKSDDPCGDYCHPRKSTAPTLGSPWIYTEKYLCGGKCYEGISDENIACRDKLNNCSNTEHYCDEAEGCQENSETCKDYCGPFSESLDYYWDDWYECSAQCLAKDHGYCGLSQTCIPSDTTCVSGCEDGL